MFVCILGRQPEISLAELTAIFSEKNVKQISPQIATVKSDNFDLSIIGGVTKHGKVVETFKLNGRDNPNFNEISQKIIEKHYQKWQKVEHKITLGISVYGLPVKIRDVQKIGLILKSSLKKNGVSIRMVPNAEVQLSTAVSHNNKLGLSETKVELMIIKAADKIFLAESCGAQNITAYARRDQNRPKRDAFVGMLPPKLAQIMLNLAIGDSKSTIILDPFCGTGTILQEALLRKFDVYGSDLSQKMIDYTKENLEWLKTTNKLATGKVINLEIADATSHIWQRPEKIDAVVCETYLGQPFSGAPSPTKLREVVGNCNHIIGHFLKNIYHQLESKTTLCIAVPAWKNKNGSFTRLPLTEEIGRLGYQQLNRIDLIYHRPNQIVGRQILVLKPRQRATKTTDKS